MNLASTYHDRSGNRFSPVICLKRTSAVHVPRYPLRLLFASASILLASSSNAYAYVDPGYGALLGELLIASFLAFSVLGG
jgi:hypothetical protein